MTTAASQTSETSALLAHNRLPAEEQVQNGDYGTNVEEGSKKDPDFETDWRIESKLLARYSTPLFFTYVLQYSFQTTTVVVAGRLGTNELGAVSLATMTANVTGLAIYEGWRPVWTRSVPKRTVGAKRSLWDCICNVSSTFFC
jgi:MatE